MLICGFRPMLDETDDRRGKGFKFHFAQNWFQTVERVGGDLGPFGVFLAVVSIFVLVMFHRGVGFALARRLLLVMLLSLFGDLVLSDLVKSGAIAKTWLGPWNKDLWVIAIVSAAAIGAMALHGRWYWLQSVDGVRYRGLDASLAAMFAVQFGIGSFAAFCAGVLIWTHDGLAATLTPMFSVLGLSFFASALLYFLAWRRQMVLAGRALPWIF